jgi:hypothetical protein
MSQKQRIFDLLAKKPATKLSATRKVKFALLDDLVELGNQAERLNREAYVTFQEYLDLQEDYARDLRTVQMLLDQKKMEANAMIGAVESKYNQMESAANDLGIELSNEVHHAYSDAIFNLQWIMDPQ